MKKLLQILLLLSIFTLGSSSCVTSRDSVRINQVEIGMNKNDIQQLLGTPLFKNANETGEEWGYRKFVGQLATAEEILFIITFDTDGKVIAYDSIKNYPFHTRY
jgi:outer membrane protein assembly factor BamE (lipoprotein component of BamABCDE complex)